MQTRLAALTARVAENGWLAAIVVVPLFFNVQTVRVFEEEKVALLRSLAIMIAAAVCIWSGEIGRGAWRFGERSIWRLPLVRPALVLTATYGAAVTWSIAPYASFWGAYIRAQGTYTWLSYIVVFLAVVLLVRCRQQLDRVVTVTLLASVPAAVYGVIQHCGVDPIPWAALAEERVHSTLGNPIFIGAYLIMVVPLTLARLIEQGGLLLRPAPTAGRLAAALLFGAYVTLLVLQLLTIVYSQSRGPFIGLGIGLTYFFIVYALHRRLRWLTIGTAASVGAAALFLVLFNMPNTPLRDLRAVPYLGRLGEISEVGSGTGKVRVLIWQGAAALLADNPVRTLVGYGPETLFLAYARFYPPELAHYESRGAAPDRSHNETFDALITTGIIGATAQLVVFLSFFFHALRWLGMMTGRRARRAFLAGALLGGTAGVCVPLLVDGSIRLAGVGLPAGIAAGCLVYLIGYALRHLREPPRPPGPDDLLLIALLAGVMAHFVEIHFGIAIAATRLSFWLYAGLALAVGVPLVRGDGEAADELPAAARPQPMLSGSLITATPIVGLILITLTFDFYRPGLDVRAHALALSGLGASVWVIGALLIVADPGARQDWPAQLVAYVATTLGIWLLFAAVYKPRIDWAPLVSELSPAVVRFIGWQRAGALSLFYGFVFLIVGLSAVTNVLREPAAPVFVRSVRRALWYPFVVVAAAVGLVSTNLRDSWADTLAKQGTFYEERGQWAAAASAHEEALRLRPHEDHYATNLGRVHMQRARGELRERPAERESSVHRALAVMERAYVLNPLNADCPRNLAKGYRTWAALSDDSAREQRLRQADTYYRQAVGLSPNNATLWTEWAMMYLEDDQPQRALEILERSLQIDDRYTTTHWLCAQAHQAMREWEAALADYDRALAINPGLLAAWSGKTTVLTHLGRTEEAIVATRQALAVAPNDLISHRNLALLYRQTGQPLLALGEARAALNLAQESDRPGLEKLISELEVGRQSGGS